MPRRRTRRRRKKRGGTNPPPPPAPGRAPRPTQAAPGEYRGTQAAKNNNKNSNNSNWEKISHNNASPPTYKEYFGAIREGVSAPAKNTGQGRNAENSARKGALAGRRSSATGPIVMAPKKKAWWKRGKYNPLNYFGGRNTRRKRRRRRRKTQRKTRRRRTKRRRRRRR